MIDGLLEIHYLDGVHRVVFKYEYSHDSKSSHYFEMYRFLDTLKQNKFVNIEAYCNSRNYDRELWINTSQIQQVVTRIISPSKPSKVIRNSVKEKKRIF